MDPFTVQMMENLWVYFWWINWNNWWNVFDLSDNVKDVSAGVIRSLCKDLDSGIGSDVCGLVERDYSGELGLKRGENVSRNVSIVVKDTISGVNLRINDSVGGGVYRGVDMSYALSKSSTARMTYINNILS